MKLISCFIKNLRIAQIFTLLSSLAVLLIILDVEESKEFIVMLAASLMFWGCLIAEQIFLWNANKQRKQVERRLSGYKAQGLPGICSFFKTKLGLISDVLWAVSTVIYIILLAGNWGEKVAQYILLFLMVLSFRLHCIANGKNYRYKHYLQKRGAKL